MYFNFPNNWMHCAVALWSWTIYAGWRTLSPYYFSMSKAVKNPGDRYCGSLTMLAASMSPFWLRNLVAALLRCLMIGCLLTALLWLGNFWNLEVSLSLSLYIHSPSIERTILCLRTVHFVRVNEWIFWRNFGGRFLWWVESTSPHNFISKIQSWNGVTKNWYIYIYYMHVYTFSAVEIFDSHLHLYLDWIFGEIWWRWSTFITYIISMNFHHFTPPNGRTFSKKSRVLFREGRDLCVCIYTCTWICVCRGYWLVFNVCH